MMKRKFVTIVVFGFMILIIHNSNSQDLLSEIKETMNKGTADFDNPETQSNSIATFDMVLDKIKLLPEDTAKSDEVRQIIAKAYELKGIALFNRADNDNAEKSFTLLIKLDPNFALDESLLSPKIIQFYKSIKNKLVGYLTISAVPSTSDVYIDSKPIGMTPLYSKEIFTGTHALSIKHKGHEDYERELNVESGAKLEILDVKLIQVSGNCIIRTSPSDVKVVLDGEVMGITKKIENMSNIPSEFMNKEVGEVKLEFISSGIHELVLKKECYREQRTKINVTIGDILFPVFTLDSSNSTVSINTVPSGLDVYIGDQIVGKTPIENKTVCSGEYPVKVNFPNKRTFCRLFNFKPNDKINIKAYPMTTLAFLGIYENDNGKVIADLSEKLYKSLNLIDSMSVIPFEFVRSTLETNSINLKSTDTNNFEISPISRKLVSIKEDLHKKLQDLLYGELFIFGIVEDNQELSRSLTIYLFNIYETKLEAMKLSNSDLSDYKVFRDKIVGTHDVVKKGLGVNVIDTYSSPNPLVYNVWSGENNKLKLGDFIVSVDGTRIEKTGDLDAKQKSLDKSLKSVKIQIIRDDMTNTVEVDLIPYREDLPLMGLQNFFYNKVMVDYLIELSNSKDVNMEDLLNFNIALCSIHFHSWDIALAYLNKIKGTNNDLLRLGVVDFYKGLCCQNMKMNDKATGFYESSIKDPVSRLFYSGGPLVSSLSKFYLESLKEGKQN
jgi:hypothetical protein